MPPTPTPVVRTELHGRYQVDFVHQSATGSDLGGDVLWFHADEIGGLRFFIADTAGSGRLGYENWQLVAPVVQSSWHSLCAGKSNSHDLQRFGEAVNDAAFASSTSLCAAAGRLSRESLEWAGWGWGVHVVASSVGEPAPLPTAESAYGLKLGWLPSADFTPARGAFVHRTTHKPTQLVLFTDGLLGNDHADPATTWNWIERVNRNMAELDGVAALEWLLANSELRGDDIAVAVVTRLDPDNVS